MAQIEATNLLPLEAQSPGLRFSEGVLRVGDSRMTLDLVVEQYENGMTPEEMIRAYDALVLADVHAAIAFYLRNREKVEAYMERRRADASALQECIENERPRFSSETLHARCSAKKVVDAPTRK